MSISCVIVDDEYLAIKILQEYASRVQYLHIEATFTRPHEALEYLSTHPVKLLFLDIQMPQIDGFELLKQLPVQPMIIFTTARHDYAVKAFDLEVLDYLVKPIPFERFEKAIRKAKDYAQWKKEDSLPTTSTTYLMVKADYRIHKITINDIEYIEGLNEYVKIHTSEKTIVPLASLKELYDQLPEGQFLRIHKSFIISIVHIAAFTHQSVHLKNGKTLPVGRSYRGDFVKQMENRG